MLHQDGSVGDSSVQRTLLPRSGCYYHDYLPPFEDRPVGKQLEAGPETGFMEKVGLHYQRRRPKEKDHPAGGLQV